MTDYFWRNLEAAGERQALLAARGELSYGALAQSADAWARATSARLPSGVVRPLVLLEAQNTIASIVRYVGCLRARWPVILAAADKPHSHSPIAGIYAPNVHVRGGGETAETRIESTKPLALHPELAVLLSTSGTTGAAKLVRLSADNLHSNAQAIASYLELSSADQAITTLPYHYSYGMSVLHSYWLSGASVVLTESSLVDTAFWDLARSQRVTSLALVPTQFDLLDKLPPLNEQLPTLRYVTQAGGKLRPRLARDFAERAAQQAWKLFIMYGQTEASPRMAFLPAEDATAWHDSIGQAVPGGALQLVDATGAAIEEANIHGELVYQGPNVMMGYALGPEHLSAEPGPSVLRTGDIAERLPNGYFKIVGRASRFLKLFGLRVSLDEVESQLASAGHRVFASGSDDRLVLFVQEPTDPTALAYELARRYGWPESAVRGERLQEPPLLASGKVDSRALSRLAATLPPLSEPESFHLEAQLRSALRASSLDMSKSFLAHGGDSLAYLEVQLSLSKRLGHAPEGWERLPLRELQELVSARDNTPAIPNSWQPVSADLLARVSATVAVVALHSTEWRVGGGAIFLLVLVGYSLARFQSQALFSGRVWQVLRAMAFPILGTYYLVVALAALRFSPFDRGWFLLFENFAQQPEPSFLLPYWFVSAYIQILAIAALPFGWGPLRRLAQRAPLACGLGALGGMGLLIELTQIGALEYSVRHRHPAIALELLITGWCIFFAQTHDQASSKAALGGGLGRIGQAHKGLRKLVVAAAIVGVWLQNYGFAEWSIAAFVLGGSLSTLGGLSLQLPGWLARALLSFGSLSLYVYLAHVPVLYEVSGALDPGPLAFGTTLALSAALALALKAGGQRLTAWRLSRREDAVAATGAGYRRPVSRAASSVAD